MGKTLDVCPQCHGMKSAKAITCEACRYGIEEVEAVPLYPKPSTPLELMWEIIRQAKGGIG